MAQISKPCRPIVYCDLYEFMSIEMIRKLLQLEQSWFWKFKRGNSTDTSFNSIIPKPHVTKESLFFVCISVEMEFSTED